MSILFYPPYQRCNSDIFSHNEHIRQLSFTKGAQLMHLFIIICSRPCELVPVSLSCPLNTDMSDKRGTVIANYPVFM